MIWLVFMVIDFPVSLGLIGLGHIIDGSALVSRVDSAGDYSTLRDLDNFWFPAVYFGLVGSIWWYSVPMILTTGFRKERQLRES